MNVGDKFSCWEVMSVGPKVTVKCECGKSSTLLAKDLISGKSKMCRACSASVAHKGHGASKKGQVSSEYVSYSHMIQRCTNPASKDWDNYGGRGITVCDMWRDSYEAFIMCMGTKPDPTYTIERLDFNKGYEPSNCVWASKTEQSRNRRSCVSATIDGKTQTVAGWIEELGLQDNAAAIYKRHNRGMSPEEAITKSITKRKKS